jgi:hypothetical protein
MLTGGFGLTVMGACEEGTEPATPRIEGSSSTACMN